ncbi:penicillin-binding protein [Pseudoflavonifractor sp. 524-17]|uniref:penicillin-binding transpeptidase domain-containing protein n=1 Tax=Pseudoflavonifractor sp. 524-17 TaxID=2304577 RepID=UPI00137B5999|nr:penicillin-binding transpeptidase domain-containing protein [Pseudoflavonifractor sp. 524-17]NCE64170.1 penicillin-binding protein [Pseudoflavonifractor sp. 524-17]
MRKIEKRAVVCLLLAAVLVLGVVLFCVRFVRNAGRWAGFPANRHLYNSKGQLSVGRVLDRDGDVLSWVDEGGNRRYYDGEIVRRATLHAVGDPAGNIGTGALVAFASKLSGYHLITGAYSPFGAGSDLYLTLDARYNYIAYQALGGKKGAVGVYNYKTGEILCMVSAPTFDPLSPPVIEDGDAQYEGVYLNRFLSGTFVPGSIFKTVTLTAAAEQLPDLPQRTFTCTGSTAVGGGTVTCPHAHGAMDIGGAFANSCNGAFALLAEELGKETMTQYASKAGLTSSYSVNGIPTAAGRFDVSQAAGADLGWAGVGQYSDAVNPCAVMVWMGAIANGGRAAAPQLILKTVTAAKLPGSLYLRKQTGTLIRADTAAWLADRMADNVAMTYGTGRFPNMDICAKSGTGEVGGGKAPNAWFAGFLRNEDAPYAFVVLVEEGGSGAEAAGNVAAAVLDALVNGY